MAANSVPRANTSAPRINTNEQTPLLTEVRPDPLPESESPLEEDEIEPKKSSNASWYLWRIFWFVVGVLFLTLFIKGWVDAGGDVDVCIFFSKYMVGVS